MAKRVTVSIPDMLHEKMEKWRTSFNLSKMFQDAVAEAIQKKEDFQRRLREDMEMGEIVERLKKEKAHFEGNWHDKGSEDGLLWARSARYEDLVYALRRDPTADICHDDVLGEYFTETVKKNKMLESSDGSVKETLSVYLDGWQKSVEEFWAAVRDKL